MEEEEKNSSNSIDKSIGKAKEKLEKAKKNAGKIKKIVQIFVKHPWLIWVIIGVIALIILLASFAWLLDLLDNENTNDSVSAATSIVSSSSSDEQEQEEVSIPSIQTTIKEIDGEYRYTFVYNITDEEKEEVNSTLNENNIDLTDENINFLTALVKHGYELKNNLDEDTLQSLLLFYKAQVASESLDLRSADKILVDGEYTSCSISLEQEGVQGTVRLERVNIDEDSKTQRAVMSYMPHESFKQLLQENSKDTKKYFTINNSGNCIIAGWKQSKVTYEYPENYPAEKEQNTNITTFSYLNGDNGIPYKNYISKYTMPNELLTSLRIYLEDIEFCKNIVKCVENSNIVISLFETTVINKNIYTEKHKIKDVKYYDYFYTKEKETTTSEILNFGPTFSSLEAIKKVITGETYGFPKDRDIIVGRNEWKYQNNNYVLMVLKNGEEYSTFLRRIKTETEGTTVSETPIILQNGKTYTALEEQGPYTVTTTIENINNTNKLYITKINTWYLNYEKKLESEGDKTTEDTGVQNSGTTQETEIDTEAVYIEYPKTELTQEEINSDKYIKKYKEKIESEGEVTWSNEKCNLYTNTIIDKIPNTYRNITEKREEKAPQITSEIKTKEDENGFLYYYDKSKNAKSNMNSISEWLFEAMEEYEKTEPLVDVIKYLLYIYSGVDYGVKELDINVEDIGELELNRYSNISLEKYLRQFSHGTTESNAPKSSDGKYYLMYGDSNSSTGYPTIGDSDIQWASHYSKFNVSGFVLENNEEKEVPNIAEYVRKKLDGNNNYQGTNAEIRAKQIYISIEVVNDVGEQIRNIIIRQVEEEIGDISLSKQQKYALIEIGYGRGHSYLEGFRDTYNEAAGKYPIDSAEFNMYIWDNWWYNKGVKSNLTKIKGQDAAFETYVKGTFNFSRPYEASWMGTQSTNIADRKYMLFYTKEQLTELENPSMKTARTKDKETELFTYVEGTSEFLETAEEIWRIVCDNFGKYGGLEVIPPQIKNNISENQIDCSGYVSWVLYEYGYTDITSQISSYGFYETNWTEKYGWEEISFEQGADITDLIQPGDIVVRRGNDAGHVAIVVEPLEDGALSYDCGNENNWIGKNGEPIEKKAFYTGQYINDYPQMSAQGKIIRVTAP